MYICERMGKNKSGERVIFPKSGFPNFRKEEKTMDENRTCKIGCDCKPIKGIKCNVENCYYHDCETHCTAHEISVGPSSASTSGETLCATFKPKDC